MKNLLILLLLTELALLPKQATATNYYFSSTDGDDSRTSAQAQSSSTPWKTIDKLNSFFSSLQPGDVVLFKRGDVFYGSISIKKSGSSGSPISFDTYGSGAKPIITGFTDVSSWSNIGGNLWMSSNSVSSLATLNIVAIRGSFAPIGRWPANGYNSLTQSGVGTSITHTSLTSNWNGATVVIRKNHWIIDKSTITSQSGTTINFSNPTSYTASSGWGFLIQNHQSACDLQNEWWYDASSKKIGIYSSGAPTGVQVASVDNLVNISSFSFINFNNITFQGSNSAAVTISSGNNIDFENCDFLFQGMNGFTVQSAAHHITLNNCTANYTNNDFIFGGGSANWKLTNNTITNTAQVPGMGNSADGNYIALYNIGANSLIQYNTIRKTGYSAIDFRGSGISVLNNVVDTFCNVKDDGAGIYTFTGTSTTTYAMRTVDQNIVLNGGGASAGTNTTNSDAFGIYMDDNSSNVTITNNTVANCGGAGLFLHAAHDIAAQNNTIYNCVTTGNYGQLLHIYPGAVTTAPVKNVTLTGNKIISKNSSQLVAYLQFTSVDMSQLGTWDNNYYCRPSNENTSTFQILSSATQTTNLAGWQSSSSKDMSSKKSPKTISDVKDLRFEYNTATSDKIVNLSATYMDVTGKNYTGSITLAPYSSAVLIYVSGTIPNQPPVANAGTDQNFSLPTSTTTLTGSGTDPDGTITAYQWTKIAGPSQFSIASPTLAKTGMSNLTQGVYQFELKVTDNSGATAKDTISITVNAISNQPPIAKAGNSQSITLPTNSVSVDGSNSTDPDGAIASYQWTKILGPASAVILNPNLAATNITSLVQGIYQFELKVTDNLGAIGKDTVQITVGGAPNQSPTANAGLDINVTLPTSSVGLSGSGTDGDGTIASYQWTKISGPSQYNLVSPGQAQTSVNNLAEGIYGFELKVTDNAGASDRDTVQIIVNPAAIPNQPPTADAGLDINITLPTNSVSLSGSGNDVDGTIASYQWTKISGPSQYTISSSTQTSTSANNLVEGIYQFELRVTDNVGTVGRDTVRVTVNAAPNQMPSADAGVDINITLPTNSVSLSGSGNDVDGTIASYQWTKISGPSQYTISSPTQTSTSANNLLEGIYQFELRVTDNLGAVDRDTVKVTVNAAPNQIPSADAGVDINITLPTNSASLSGSGNDVDGTIASYQWTKISGPSQYNIGSASQASTSVNNLVQGVYQFELRVTDNSGAAATDVVQVTVNAAPNQLPSADAGVDINITLPTNKATLSGSGLDPDGTIVSYQWTKISGPTQYTISFPTRTRTTIDNLTEGIYEFELQVTDNSGAVATDVVQVTVNAAAQQPNQDPQANAGPDLTITLPVNNVTLNGNGSDPDGNVASYQWTMISGPSQYNIASATQARTSVNNLAEGVYEFELQVTDNSGATGLDIVQITVNAATPTPNQSPSADAGADIIITLPTNSTTLSGGGIDQDGTIASYQWTKIAGPSQYNIALPGAAQTLVDGLTQGVYAFELTVTDNSGAIAKDIVQIFVNAAPNQSPAINAGSDISITLPTNSTTLSGTGVDADGWMASYQWRKISGPSQYNIGSPNSVQTSVNNLTQGVYSFELMGVDNSGATAKDTVQIFVNAAPNQSPAINAGSDISIILPTNSTTLSGTGADADGWMASYQWRKISGPSQYNIASPNSVQTSVNNLTQGVYSFELMGVDNSGATAKDTVQIFVNAAPNQSPAINAGADISITLPTNSTTLSGTGTDADGWLASYQWRKISGPSQYNVVSPNSGQTSVNNLTQGVYAFELMGMDNSGATAKDTVQITVNAAPNQSPAINAGADISITLPTNSTTLSGTGTDADGWMASYQWRKISGPSQYNVVSPNSGQTSVNNLTQGVYAFELMGMDNSGAAAKDTVQIFVNAAPNQAPAINAGANISITLPTNSTTLSGTGADADGWMASYQWRKISGPSQYNIASSNSAQTLVNNLTQGVYAFELMGMDNSGAAAKDTVQITVNAAPNQSPTADAGVDINITLPTNSITLSGSGVDPDGTIASYSWKKIAGPTQYNITSATLAKTGVNNLTQGTYDFELTVTDNSGASKKDTVEVTVNAAVTKPNQVPEANAGNDLQITLPTNSVRLSGSGVDPDGQIASYRWSSVSGPKGFTILSPTRSLTTVNSLVKGVYNFELTVTDNSGGTDKDTVQVTVLAAPPNKPPTANAGTDKTITLPTNSTSLSGSGSDPDGTVSSYQWRKISGPSQYNISSSSKAQATANSLVQGIYKFEFTVTDNSGASVKDTMQVTVNAAPINQSPTAKAGTDITITLPTNSTTLSGTGTDPDGTIASYKWTKVSGPSQYNIGSSSQAQTSVTNLVQGVYRFELTVTDNSGKTGKDTVQVTVSAAPVAPNKAPTANAGLDINITLPTNSTDLLGSGTDVDGTIASYQWKKISGPTQFNIVSASKAQITINNLAEGTYQFELTVTDNSGASAKDTVQVIVNPESLSANHVPTANAGSDLEITLPTNSVKLSGKGSDVDGKITSYKWKKTSGPAQYNIASSTTAETDVNNLEEGSYQFELTVTDDKNGSGKSTVQVTVHAAPNQSPTAKAGSDLQISLPTDTATLTGTGTDPDGTIASYKWTKISGPVQTTFASPSKANTLISNLTEGAYQFELTVTDNSGAIAKDTVEVTVFRQPTSFAKVFPNPATSVINIQIEGATTTSHTALRIYDNKGNLVYQEDFVRPPTPMIKQVNVSNLPGGIYFAELQTETSSITTLRFMKK